MNVVKFKKLHEDAKPYVYTRPNDACMDMFSLYEVHIAPGETKKVPTGIAVELPKGFEGRVRGRSGLASKGIISHNGTIDEEYRGDVSALITNHGKTMFIVNRHDRVAQFSINPVYNIEMVEVEQLSNTIRGEAGFGSSGV